MSLRQVFLLAAIILHIALASDIEFDDLPLKDTRPDPNPPNPPDPCASELGQCTCGGKGEPHFSTCDGRHFPYPAPTDKIGNLASDSEFGWYVWTKHALYAQGRTYISAVRFGCSNRTVDFNFNPPGNTDAPETWIDGDPVMYPPKWNNTLPPGATGAISAGKLQVEVVQKSFPSIPGSDKQRTYLAAHCTIAEGIKVSVFVRLRTVVVQIHQIYCKNIKGICGDYNGDATNDETNLANTPDWAPLLMPPINV